ncbi:MAG: threonine/serine dehydratase [Armatimonadota bacterium]|nr:threonine/serine dehydratase [Armatimonadota bacterium]MDR7421124.1 threonine/serine dehydratase [Armatimonadota bacterium]MDR7455597.1 threonine/serine dehydratase [Armatimonadota bacterium]MDR7457474.1 threonine/serine dehydratase [Armatimonadota bacterium]MDR7496130.1 threonine/serine dehydratase [Armatimonadota bacterium]
MPSGSDPSLAEVEAARALIADRVHRTPLVSSQTLADLAGAPILLKAENLQKTGSFKARGATNAVRRLGGDARAAGIVTISAGNHAQAVAYAAAAERVRCVVVMHAAASAGKVAATRAFGAEVVLHGTPHEAFARFEALQRERGLVPVHPFDDPDVIAGQGTVGLEIAEDAPDAGLVVVPVGGGGLISGIALALRGRGMPARIVGVEPEGSAAMRRALDAGRPVALDAITSIADGLGAPAVSERTLRLVRHLVDDVVLVTDAEIVDAMRLLLERTKLLAEPAGAAGLAAALSGRLGRFTGPIVVVLSGGNVDLGRLCAWL